MEILKNVNLFVSVHYISLVVLDDVSRYISSTRRFCIDFISVLVCNNK